MEDRRERILAAATRCIARRGVRGLRIQEVASEAGVSPALLYYHFTDRAGLLAASLEFVAERAARYTADAEGETEPLERIRRSLLDELQDRPDVIENSAAWGELRASAIFESSLRAPLAEATRDWIEAVAALIEQAQHAGVVSDGLDPGEAASALTALVEGLSNRWLSGSITLADARRVLGNALEHALATGALSRTTPEPAA